MILPIAITIFSFVATGHSVPAWEQFKMDSVVKPLPPQTNNKIAEDGVYLIVDEMPTYPGGEPAMKKFLRKNVKYPIAAIEKGLSGIMYVKFDIDVDGAISNVHSTNKSIGVLEAEAIRVVKKMPNWNPGKEKGNAVRVRYVLPVPFTMTDK